MALNVVMLGPPASGKGTQAVRLAQARSIPKISTGDILREAAQSGSDLGRRAKALMDRGELLGDEEMIGIVKERLARPDAADGYILDGFPRTVRQAEALDRLLHDEPLVIVDLALPRDVDTAVAGLPGVHVVDLAMLQGERAAHPGRPVAGSVAADDIAAAHALVELETSLLRAERQAAAVAPTVSALRSQAAEVVDAELLRLSTRLPDLDAKARSEIARTVRRVVDKLRHEPTVRVKELASAPNGTDYADALRALFGLGIDADVPADGARLAEAVAVDPDDLRPGGAA